MRHSIVDEKRNFFEAMNDLHSKKDAIGSQKFLTGFSHKPSSKGFPIISKTKHVTYQVYVSTAGYKSAGTDKPVYIQISGDSSTTEFILLDDASPNITESGMHYANPESIDPGQENYGFPAFSVRDFRFKASFIGNITNISLKHDPKAYEQSTWRPENILVISIHLHRAWLFTCSKWLSYKGGNQVILKPITLVYAGPRSCRNISQALLVFKSHYAKANILPEVEDTKKELEKNFDLRSLHETEMKKSEKDILAVRFRLQKFTKTSAHMYLLGNTEALGEWDPERAIRMNMILSPDGIWRGSWEIELCLDNDFGELKYTYLTVVEGRNEDPGRSFHYGDVHKLTRSTFISSKNFSENRTVTINDSYEDSPERELLSSVSCHIQNNVKEKTIQQNHKSEIEELFSCLSMGSPFQKLRCRGHTLAKKNSIQQEQEKSEDTSKARSETEKVRLEDNLRERSPKDLSSCLGDVRKTYSTLKEPDARTNVETQSEDHEHIRGDKNEPSRTNLKNLFRSSDQQLLQSSKKLRDSKSELHMLKNNISFLRVSLCHESKNQTSHTFPSFLVDEVGFNLEKYKKFSTKLSRSLREELAFIKESVVVFNEMIDEHITQLRNSIVDKERFSSRAKGKILSEKKYLEERLAKEFEEKRDLFNQIQNLQGNIRVFCRVRPMLHEDKGENEIIPGLELLDQMPGVQDQLDIGGKAFRFQTVFPPSCSQYEVYDKTAGVVRSVLDGYNVCIMAYGQTGSGKTYTMNGTEHNKGVNYRALEDLFNVAEDRSLQYNTIFHISVLEIYKESLRDLLETKDTSKKLDVRKDISSPGRAVFVQNLNKVEVISAETSWKLMKQAMENRSTQKTEMNEHSSRSHLIFKLHVRCEHKRNGLRTLGELTFVDLAGSERVTRSRVSGDRLKEAQCINKSLSTLGDVFNALISRSSHVPYRNSKLTYLLQDSLGGSSKTLMFFNISPSMKDFAETISSLQFSQRVATVELGVAQRSILRKDEVIHKSIQTKEIELKSLRSKLAYTENENKKKALLISESEKKTRAIEEELRKTKKSLEISKQKEKELCVQFDKKLRELNTKKTTPYGSFLLKDVERNRQKGRKWTAKDCSLPEKINGCKNEPSPNPKLSHKKPLDASSSEQVASKSNHFNESSSKTLSSKIMTDLSSSKNDWNRAPLCNAREERIKIGKKKSLESASNCFNRSGSVLNASSSSSMGLPRSSTSDSEITPP